MTTILHITAGDENWNLTQGELNHILELFRDATFSPRGEIIVTRKGVDVHPSVSARIIYVDDIDLVEIASRIP